jgi:hypothetical protein
MKGGARDGTRGAAAPHPDSRLEQGERLIIEPEPPRSLLAVLASLEPLGEAFPPIPELPADSPGFFRSLFSPARNR